MEDRGPSCGETLLAKDGRRTDGRERSVGGFFVSMSPEELAEHADALRNLLRSKERQLRYEVLTPSARESLALQINALIDRVNQVDQGVTRMIGRSSQTPTG